MAEANRQLLLANGIAVWLDCPWETVERRVSQASHRPLARDAEKFRRLFDERRAIYALADVRVPVESDDPAAAVETILQTPDFRKMSDLLLRKQARRIFQAALAAADPAGAVAPI